ncbi:erbin isoform X1 [Polypterus senegalus]|uniref:erbin isoform X1 n=1 Tax=Polypterus senegalus TaxID=55291 RepID=UPI0019651A74|nr:erbin isoform X1 [Polypterus senegalus]XP_039614599.1 erbin isoform X1 [Polypterus senegalus]XP_039614600.1 erbin isoform X1 [Polypterus senegalus]
MTTKRNLFVRLVPCRCLRGEEEIITKLDYSHCSLEQVPKEIFTFEKTLEELYLDANQIEELPKQLFNCQALHKLSLPDNDLTVLPASIANLINLRELDVSKNGIQEFPENIKNCKVLTIVEASVNPISKLPDGFTQLLSLSQLYLNDAFLEFLPANFGRLTKLQILELRENQLKMLPKTMNKLTQLERLDLGSNEFTEVPEVIEQLTGLKEFWMDGNRLTFVPGIIGSLKQLTYLDLSKNNIEMIDDQLAGCESLQDLLLSNNALQQLPGSVGSLKKLSALKIDENQIMYLPETIGGLTSLEELDCSFNEIEALPSSIGHFTSLRTFAADHNFLTQLPPEVGNWKNATVLFLHSNKLESLPEEMGEMQKLKVINLSDNRLKNLPFSFTKLNQLTAMWLSENQSKPLIPLQKEEDEETGKTVLTNYMFPQQPRTEEYLAASDNESFNPSLWEEQRKQRAQVAFECDEDKDERETPPREGILKRYPTPYPEELKSMVKTAQNIAHRLKEDESSDESGKEIKQIGDEFFTVRDAGVKTLEHNCINQKPLEADPIVTVNCMRKPAEDDSNDTKDTSANERVKVCENSRAIINHEDTLEDSEDLSSDEDEMKIAEMRPPLIEISINQPKVVALSKDKKDDSKDVDSLLEDTAVNSNQNNSNCSSPSRMSDSVSLTTDSSQDISLSTPEKETKVMIINKIRQDDENSNLLKETSPLLQNGSGSDSSLQVMLKSQQENDAMKEGLKISDFGFMVEKNLAFIEREIDLKNGLEDPYSKLDQINQNVSIHSSDYLGKFGGVGNNTDTVQEVFTNTILLNNNIKDVAEYLENGNSIPKQIPNQINGRLEETTRFPLKTNPVRTSEVGVLASVDMSLSKSTEELSPQKHGSMGPVVKSQSVTNIEIGGLKIHSNISDSGPQQSTAPNSVPIPNIQGQCIVRSKSASLLDDQPLQVFPGSSCSSSDLISVNKLLTKYDGGFNTQNVQTCKGNTSNLHFTGSPQYNIQYTSSTVPKDGLWTQRMVVPFEQGNLAPSRLQRSDSTDSYTKHIVNTNYSNRNAQGSLAYTLQQRGNSRPVDMWGAPVQKDRLVSSGSRSTLQRQSSTSSSASVSMGEVNHPRRVAVPEGDYLTYRDIHTMGRGIPVNHGLQRPLSARTYSIDGPNVPRPQSARPSVHEVPERTMSVSDFNYSRTSPSKRANVRVKSEHSLLDTQGVSRVPPDWRDQVLRHIEARKLEKTMLSRSFNSNYVPVSTFHFGSSRDLHGSQGSIAFSSADRRHFGADMFCDDVFCSGQQNYAVITHGHKEVAMDSMRKVPLSNGQMCPASRSQINSGQVHCPPQQGTVVRHPSREQLIDYLMLKVNQTPQYNQSQGPTRSPHECVQQEVHVKLEKNPELGFSISGGIGGRGNPFRPDDTGIFVTRVQPEGAASKLLQPGDKIIKANGYSFVNIDHGYAVSLLKTFQTTVDLIILREVPA